MWQQLWPQLVSSGLAALALVGLLLVATPKPSDTGPQHVGKAARIVRVCAWIALVLVATELVGRVGGRVWPDWMGIALGAVGPCLCVVLALALIRHLTALVRRLPNKVAVLFGRLLFLASIPLFAATCAAMFAADVVAVMTPTKPPYAIEVAEMRAGAATAPTSSPTWVIQKHYVITDGTGRMTGTATVPASMPILPDPRTAFWRNLDAAICTKGVYYAVPWGLGGIVFLVVVERLLARAARQARELYRTPEDGDGKRERP
jgi:hypothetical protein